MHILSMPPTMRCEKSCRFTAKPFDRALLAKAENALPSDSREPGTVKLFSIELPGSNGQLRFAAICVIVMVKWFSVERMEQKTRHLSQFKAHRHPGFMMRFGSQ
eukprot:IDg11382t1